MKRYKMALALGCLLCVGALAACGGVNGNEGSSGPATSIVLEDKLLIAASSLNYEVGGEAIKLSVDASSVLTKHQAASIRFAIVGTNTIGGKIEEQSGAYYFSATGAGEVSINAHINDLVSSNVIVISSRNGNATIATNLQSTLDAGPVFGQSYDLGIAQSEASQYAIGGAEGILKINSEGKLEIIGIGSGKVQLSKSGTKIFDNYYNIYNSILCTKIKEDLISQGVIQNKSSNVTAAMLHSITKLSLAGELKNDPTSSYGVKYLTSLTELDLSGNGLTDLSFVSTITTLTKMNLADNAITNIDYIVDNQNLAYLDLKDNQVTDLKKVQYLHKIAYLDLSNNGITGISYLSSVYSLTALFLNDNPLAVFKDPLSGLENLTELGIGHCNIAFADIASFNYTKNLTYLDISGTDPNLATLGKLSKLSTLILADCQVEGKTVSSLNALTGLKRLDLSSNGLDTAGYGTGLDPTALTALEELDLGGNEFTVIPDLSGFTSLTTLGLTNSYNLTSLSSIASLPLKSLVLDDCNSIDATTFQTTIAAITSLTKLSIVGAFNYMTEALYNQLTTRVASGGFSLRFLSGVYVDSQTIENYKKSVFFDLASFLAACTLNADGSYTASAIGSAAEIVLSLVNDTSSKALGYTRIQFDRSLFRFSLFGNRYKTYAFQFDVLDRKESSFTLALSSLYNIGINGTIVTAADGSKTKIETSGSCTFRADTTSSVLRVYDLTVSSLNGSFTILGGRGTDGVAGTYQNNHDATDGTPGSEGGDGIHCHSCLLKSGSISIQGGAGGNGGHGGNSGAGIFDWGTQQNGGDGGRGGIGGSGVVYSGVYSNLCNANVQGGAGGSGGEKGQHAQNGVDGQTGADGADGSSIRKVGS